MSNRRLRGAHLTPIVLCASAMMLGAQPAHADSFSRAYFDSTANQLIVTMRYRGTNADHSFSLKWGGCSAARAGELPEVSAEVLDDQWRDQAVHDFQKTMRFSVSELPCRPAKVILRTAPRFIYTLIIR